MKTKMQQRKTILNLRFFLGLLIISQIVQAQIPDSFVELSEVNPDIKIELRYYSPNNFIGDTIDGYFANKLFLTKDAAQALDKVQMKLDKLGLGLKVFDGYRPQMAVDHFVRWARILSDTVKKSIYYPDVAKAELFKKGYIASRSGHSRGSTVDLTLIGLESGRELDMGSPFDLFDFKSHQDNDKLSPIQLQNRKLLKSMMLSCKFKPYSKEWWHYTLVDEPFPKTYFNFEIR